jgi:hypothetical protein
MERLCKRKGLVAYVRTMNDIVRTADCPNLFVGLTSERAICTAFGSTFYVGGVRISAVSTESSAGKEACNAPCTTF